MKNNQKIQNISMDIVKTLRSEFHFLKYPFFNLSNHETKRSTIEVREIEKTDNGKIEILWQVSRNINTNFPSTFARKIHKEIVERILNQEKLKSRLIKLGSLRQICKVINITPSGRSFNKIKNALRDILGATIETKRTFRLKEKDGRKKFFEGMFHLYDGVYFLGERLPDGTEADAIYVLLNDMYLQNFNNNFVVPLDYDYMYSLKGNIASRLYEILLVWLYPAFTNNKHYIEKSYSELCDYFPLMRQDIKWKARQQLKTAHNQHIASGFIRREPQWKEIGKRDDWLIEYQIGPKAREWYYNIKHRKPIEIKACETIEDKSNNDPLLSKLLALKISRNRAEKLIKEYDNVSGWLEALDIIKPQNKAGFLIAALREGYSLPDELKKRKTARDRKKEEELKTRYYENIFEQVDKHLAAKMNETELKEELAMHKEEFLRKFPKYKQFKDSIFINPLLEQDYKTTKAEELGLISFKEWKKEIR